MTPQRPRASSSPHPLVRAGYAALLAALTPAYLAKLWWRGRAEPAYRQSIGERFGFYRGEAPKAGPLWIHAVSLGETRAAAALIDALRERVPGLTLLLTHGTATGREAGRALLREGDRQAWLPWDSNRAVQRFLRRFQPSIGILMETEVWPNLLLAARAAGVPMVLANARLSARSERRGRRLDALLRPAIESFALVLAQSRDDAARLRAVGAREVVVAGNLKFDLTPDPDQLARGRAWRAALGRPVVLAAVTREGEEEPLLAAWLKRPAPRPLLLVVPRHPQRFDEVAGLVRAAGCSLARRSEWGDAPGADVHGVDVWLGDSIGEMAVYYALADVALLGGSFAPLGGQNLIEAAACGCPIVMGPHTFNFAEAARLALAAGAALRVADIEAAVDVALSMTRTAAAEPIAAVRAPDGRSSANAGGASPASTDSAANTATDMPAAARAFAAEHRGAAARMAARIVAMLPAALRSGEG